MCVCVRACVRACVFVCVCVCHKKEKKEKLSLIKKQPLGAVWCKTRLLNSGSQFDQLCNLIDGAILARAVSGTMLTHSRAIIAYGNGRSKVQRCMTLCM